ncbi:MAG: RNA polymerase sigma factor [Chloroflexi bacterium]|nr:RNA polymerase sigma factor [Chloroflexota bacterium]
MSEDLIKQAQAGSDAAFTTLFEQYVDAVYNYAVWLSGDPLLGDDLTQEAFIRAPANIHRIGPPYNFRAWMFQIARNLFLDHQRGRSGQPIDPIPESAQSEDLHPELALAGDEQAQRVQAAVMRLPEPQREVLVLREFSSMSYRDIAEVMDVSTNHVGVLLHRARDQFKDVYAVQILAEDPAPPCEKLGALLDIYYDGGPLSDEEYQLVEDHLNSCLTCQRRKRELTAMTALMGLVPVFPRPVGQPSGLEASTGASAPYKASGRTIPGWLGPVLAIGVITAAVTVGLLAFNPPQAEPIPTGEPPAAEDQGGDSESAAGSGDPTGVPVLPVEGSTETPTALPASPTAGGTCGDAICDPDSEDADICPADCAVSPSQPGDPPATQAECVCGDGICSGGCENSDLCPADCACVDDGVCSAGEGAGCRDCSGDAAAQCGVPCPEGGCGSGLSCAGGVCWDDAVCGTSGSPGDGGAQPTDTRPCGDGVCDPTFEDERSCPQDCP